MSDTVPPPSPETEPEPSATCRECRRTRPTAEMMAFAGDWVCGNCKTVFFQRLRENVGESFATQTAHDPKAVPGCWSGALFLFGFWALTLVCGVILAIGLLLAKQTGIELNEAALKAANAWVGGAVNLVIFAILLVLGLLWAKRPVKEVLPFRAFPLPALVPMLMLAVGWSFVVSDIDNLIQYFLPAPALIKQIMQDLLSSGAAAFFVLVIVAPVTEELFFRGFMLDGFRRRYTPTTAILLSSAMFAVFHLNPYQFVGAFILGIAMAWLRLQTESLWPCLFVHAAANGTAFVFTAAKIPIPGYSWSPGTAHQFQPLWFTGLGVGLAVTGTLGIWLLLGRTPPRPAHAAESKAPPPP